MGKKRPYDAVICDANVLIDLVASDESVISKMVKHFGVVNVPDTIVAEVRALSLSRAEELGLTILETPLQVLSHPGLSYPDRVCLHFVQRNEWLCITNDRKLRAECVAAGKQVMWGLEVLLELVREGKLTSQRAKRISRGIAAVNPEVTKQVIERFDIRLQEVHRF